MSVSEARARIESVLGRRHMAPERRLLVLAGAVTAAGTEDELEAYFSLTKSYAVDPDPLAEVVLQTYLFAGYPRAINALFAYRDVFGDRSVPVEPALDAATIETRGEALCRIVYGDHYEALRRNIASLHPDLDRWMLNEGYGRVLGRPMVDTATRELAAVSALVVQGARRQLRSHLLGARHAGASPREIEETVEQTRVLCEEDAWRSATALAARLLRLS
jgi:4-carboxymuconolactone decarboxylase